MSDKIEVEGGHYYIIEKRFKKPNNPPTITINQDTIFRNLLELFKFPTFRPIAITHKTSDSTVVVKRPLNIEGK